MNFSPTNCVFDIINCGIWVLIHKKIKLIRHTHMIAYFKALTKLNKNYIATYGLKRILLPVNVAFYTLRGHLGTL